MSRTIKRVTKKFTNSNDNTQKIVPVGYTVPAGKAFIVSHVSMHVIDGSSIQSLSISSSNPRHMLSWPNKDDACWSFSNSSQYTTQCKWLVFNAGENLHFIYRPTNWTAFPRTTWIMTVSWEEIDVPYL
jgi:hypothetical protein